MALTIYGSPRSRTMRVLWMATELGLEFSHVPLSFDDPTLKSPDFIRINRAGAVPAIVDDGYALAESLAINLYLAKKYAVAGAASLYPGDLEGEAQAWRWTLWAQAHLEPWIQRDASLADLREAVGHLGNAAAAKALSVLEEELAGRPMVGRGILHGRRSERRGRPFTLAGGKSRFHGLPPRPRLADLLLSAAGRDRGPEAFQRGRS
jgi:glutathione S-transferase